MSIVYLQDIINKIRRLTGMGTSLQMPDFPTTGVGKLGITDYINSFYLYDFPAQYRSLNLKGKFTFNTVQGIDTYPFDTEHFTTIEMPCYCAKREIKLFQDPWSFFGVNYNWQQMTNFDYGDGTTGPYSGTLTLFSGSSVSPNGVIVRSVVNNPMVTTIPSQTDAMPTSAYPTGYPLPFPQTNPNRTQNILITTNTATGTLNVTDDGAGNLIGDCSAGTIDYFTGVIANLTFTATVPQGNAIQAQYCPAQPSIPLSVLFFQNQLTLRPVPDQGYTIELVAYRQPSQVLLGSQTENQNTSGVPELSEWWECLAFGAAKKIYEDRLDPDGVALMDKALKEKYSLIQTRTYAQLGKQSISTMFRDQLSYNYGSGQGLFGGP